jgi:hypothetical protein
MGNTKETSKGGSQSSMGNKPDREFETQGKDKDFEKKGQPGKSTASPGMIDDEDVDTAGGKKGQFSDKERASAPKWSPGSGESHSE